MQTAKKVAGLKFHPKIPGLGPEHLQRLAGIVALRGPIPAPRFMDAATRNRAAERARD